MKKKKYQKYRQQRFTSRRRMQQWDHWGYTETDMTERVGSNKCNSKGGVYMARHTGCDAHHVYTGTRNEAHIRPLQGSQVRFTKMSSWCATRGVHQIVWVKSKMSLAGPLLPTPTNRPSAYWMCMWRGCHVPRSSRWHIFR